VSDSDLQRQLDRLFEELQSLNVKFDSYVPRIVEQGTDIKWIKGSGGAIITFISSLIAVAATSLLHYLSK